MSKAQVAKFREAVVNYKDGENEDEIRVREYPGGYIISDFASGETPYSIRLTKQQWKAVKKAVKALKKGKKNRVKEEADPPSSPDSGCQD